MKKCFMVFLIVILAAGLTACAEKSDKNGNDLEKGSQAEEMPEPVQEDDKEEDTAGGEEMPETQPVEAKDYKAGVIDASRLFIKNGVAFWGYGQQLCSALIDEEHNLYEFISEGTLNGEIYCIAIEDNNMYLSTEKGIVCLPLEERGQ